MKRKIEDKADININIVGAGLAGLCAAVHLAKAGVTSRLISSQNSERAQSVLAEGGINGALNTMGENDSVENHYQDTIRSGCGIANEEAVLNLTKNAPDIIKWLEGLGVPFQKNGNVIQLRNFGGQTKKRTAFAKNSTGKVIMTALIDESRRYEALGLIKRFPHHNFVKLIIDDKRCEGVVIRDNITSDKSFFFGPVLMAVGGLNGLFAGETTGTTANTADAAAIIFSQGVRFSNLEMIQYHPTTFKIPGKRLLVSEAARGEGGRLFIYRGGEKWYFMDEKYPELGSLMPRDVISREEYFVQHDQTCEGQVYLDCTSISSKIWKERLSDLREELIYYTKLDPARDPIPVESGIHYFMGGIDTDVLHRTNIKALYAAGECCGLYHGANRLGGNSMLGALYGGKKAAQTITDEAKYFNSGYKESKGIDIRSRGEESYTHNDPKDSKRESDNKLKAVGYANNDVNKVLCEMLVNALGVVREKKKLEKSVMELTQMLKNSSNALERARLSLGIAILKSALFRKESRGAHYLRDYPLRNDEFLGTVIAQYNGQNEFSENCISFYLRKTNV